MIKNIFLAVAICLIFPTTPIAQSVTIKGKMIDQQGNPVTNGEFIVLQPGSPPFFNTIPGAKSLKQKNFLPSTFQQAGQDGKFVFELEGNKPVHILFTADNKSTVGTIFPLTSKKQVSLEITFYDNELVREESVSPIKVNDQIIQEWMNVYAFSSTSANTDIFRYHDARIKYKIANGSDDGFSFELEPFYRQLTKWYSDAKDKGLKNYILLKLAELAATCNYPVDQKYLLEAIAQIPANDYLWITEYSSTNNIYRSLGKFKMNKELLLPFLEAVISECPVPDARPRLLYSLLYDATLEGIPEAGRYYTQLVTDFPGSTQANMAIANAEKLKLSKNKKGDFIPSFSVAKLDDTTRFITNETLKGKVVLIDFWATWCGPCIEQLHHIEKAYAKYKSKGFEVLSITLDKDPETAQVFRTKKHQLPWLNGFIGMNRKILMDQFEFTAIPRVLLVDKDGKIISSTLNELTDENLDILLAKLFEEK